jgi:hypothetical protein
VENDKDEDFDLEELYDREMQHMMNQLLELARKHNIPFVAAVNFSREGDLTGVAHMVHMSEPRFCGPIALADRCLDPKMYEKFEGMKESLKGLFGAVIRAFEDEEDDNDDTVH